MRVAQVALVRLVVVALLCALGGAKRIDTIIINYVLVGLTAVLVLMARYPIAVMLTIRCARRVPPRAPAAAHSLCFTSV